MEIESRRASSHAKIVEIQGLIADAQKRAQGKACIYATGSYGRREAGENSDLDLFILGLNSDKQDSRNYEDELAYPTERNLRQGKSD